MPDTKKEDPRQICQREVTRCLASGRPALPPARHDFGCDPLLGAPLVEIGKDHNGSFLVIAEDQRECINLDAEGNTIVPEYVAEVLDSLYGEDVEDEERQVLFV